MKISIIIPVYKEDKIESFLKEIIGNKTLQNYELIVVDGDDKSVKEEIKISDITLLKSEKGRAKQMNEGAEKATSDTLLFLHADTILPDYALEYIREALKDKEISAGAFDLDFDTKKKSLKFIAYCASRRSRLTRLPYGDQAIFIKKDVFDRVGGYSDMMLMEDVNLMQKLKKSNYRIKLLKSKVITSPRKWEQSGVIYTTLRNWLLLSLYFIGIKPDMLARYYK